MAFRICLREKRDIFLLIVPNQFCNHSERSFITLPSEMTNTGRIPVWLDCDPGQDDAVAIIIACYSVHFDLLGISTVHGNVSLQNTTCNALRVLTAIGKTDIPVYSGEEKPLDNYAEVFAADVHGKTGLNGSNLLPVSKMKAKNKSDLFPHLARVIEENESRLNIVATGPLTNIATFFKQYPHLRSKINWLSVMGGGFEVFNINGNAEFNYYCDPFAAKEIVQDEILSKKMIQASLDITSKVFISSNIQQRVLDGKNLEQTSNFRAMMYELIDSFNKRMLAKKLPGYKGPVIHDPVALVALLQFLCVTNELEFSYDRRTFEVSIDPTSYGAITGAKNDEQNGIYVLKDLSVSNFWEEVLEVYDAADRNAYMNTIPREELIEKSVLGDC